MSEVPLCDSRRASGLADEPASGVYRGTSLIRKRLILVVVNLKVSAGAAVEERDSHVAVVEVARVE